MCNYIVLFLRNCTPSVRVTADINYHVRFTANTNYIAYISAANAR